MNVTIQFVGGPLDGTVTIDPSGPSPQHDPAKLNAWMFYGSTRGEVGKASQGYSPAALEIMTTKGSKALDGSGVGVHTYRVSKRNEEGGQLSIQAEYCPKPTSASRDLANQDNR